MHIHFQKYLSFVKQVFKLIMRHSVQISMFVFCALITVLLNVPNGFCQASQALMPPAFDYEGPHLDNPTITTDGKVRVVWIHELEAESDQTILFELHQSQTETFEDHKLIYKGQDMASFISGLPDGSYYFRVRAINPTTDNISDWSESLVVNVQHYSLSFAFTLMLIGGIVFILTVFVVVYGTITINKQKNTEQQV